MDGDQSFGCGIHRRGSSRALSGPKCAHAGIRVFPCHGDGLRGCLCWRLRRRGNPADHRIAISLHSRDAGQWVGGASTTFEDALRDVKRVEIQLARAGMAAQRYQIDDVFIDVLPAGAGIAADGTLMWSRLRTNVAYVVQAALNPTQEWEDVNTFVATARIQTWVDPAPTNDRQKVYRLIIPELQP